jgi:hypothetical protein
MEAIMVSGRSDKKHFGAGHKGKGDGSGAMSDVAPERVPDSMVLSNRNKSEHSKMRGQDSKNIETEQLRDNAANRDPRKDH